VAHDPAEKQRGAVVESLARSILLTFWSLVLWGTLYAILLIHAAAAEGPRAVLHRVLSGQDALGGCANLALAVAAAVVWIVVAVRVWRERRERQ
jgi:hypothetical protein